MLQKAGARMGALWISRSTRKAQRIRTATGYRKPNLHTVAAHGVAPSAMFEPLREARLNKNSGVAPDAVRAMLEGFSLYAVQVCRLHDASACILGCHQVGIESSTAPRLKRVFTLLPHPGARTRHPDGRI